MLQYTVSLQENTLFKRAYYRGKSFGNPFVVVYLRRNGLSYNRLGITASKKIGGACVRNRARRVLREAYRLTETAFPKGFDVVLVARTATPDKKTQDLQRALEGILRKFTAGGKK